MTSGSGDKDGNGEEAERSVEQVKTIVIRTLSRSFVYVQKE